MSLDTDTRQRIEEMITSNDVVLFMKGNRAAPQCGFSSTLVGILDGLVADYATANVLADSAVREGIKEYSQWPTIPQLYVRGEFLGGCDIVQELAASGELAQSLGVNASPPSEQPEVSVTPAGAEALRAAAGSAPEDAVLHLGVDARFEPNERALDFEIEFADAARNLVFEISGSHDPALGTGRAVIEVEPIEFFPGGLQPADLSPALAGLITETSGSITMVGSADWRAHEWRGQLEVGLVDLSVTSEAGNIDGMNAKFAIGSDGIIAIESASWKFAGGTLTTAGTIDPLAPIKELTVRAKGLDLATLITLVNLEGLSGSGTLDGEIPIVRDGDETEIRQAKLHSVGEGDVIRYRPEASVASLGVADDQFAMALAVLENFHYEQIGVEIDGNPSGDAAVQIHLEGANPDHENGRAVAFNLSVDAALSDLLETQMYFYRIPDLIEERVRAHAARNK